MPHRDRSRRRQLMVDSQVQGAILWRLTLYWLCTLLCVAVLQACWILFTSRLSSSRDFMYWVVLQSGPGFVASLLVLPILMVDCARLTNRFAGPIVRLKRHMRQVAQGNAAPPLQLREGDFWQDLADDYNHTISQLDRGKNAQQNPPSAGASAVTFPSLCATTAAQGQESSST